MSVAFLCSSIQVSQTVSAEAKELLARQISLLVRNPAIATPEQLMECQADIRDPEMANLFYGPIILKGAK